MIRTETILDLATIGDQTHAEALEGSIALAQTAEKAGYERIWYAEHHNMPTMRRPRRPSSSPPSPPAPSASSSGRVASCCRIMRR